jgi:hypothetical protein
MTVAQPCPKITLLSIPIYRHSTLSLFPWIVKVPYRYSQRCIYPAVLAVYTYLEPGYKRYKRHWSGIYTYVTAKCKRPKRTDNLLLKDKRKNKIMNSPRTKQHICKPHQPKHNQSLQKSCFFADAPADNVKFVGLNNENKQG